MSKKLLEVLLVMQLLGGAAAAAETQQLTLKEAISRGLERNSQLLAARHQADAAKAGAVGSGLHYLPSVTLEEAWSRSNVPVNTFMMKLNQGRFTNQDFDASKLNNPSPATDFRTMVTVEQPILVPSALAGHLVARSGSEKQDAISAMVREQVAMRIFQIYLEVGKARAYLKAAEKGVEEASESRRLAAVRTAAGLGLKSDELRGATHLASMEQARLTAANNVTLARMQLAIAIGGEPGEEVDTAEPGQIKANWKDLEELKAKAVSGRQDLVAAIKGKEQADAAVLQTRAGFLPNVGAVGAWQMNDKNSPFGRDHDSWMLGVALKWNIFDGFRTVQGNSQAVAARSAAGEMLTQTRKEVGYQVHEAWLRWIEAEKRRQVALSALASAEEAFRLLSRRFENSLATMVELLDAQSALNQVRANMVESEANLMLATGQVYFSAGIFTKEVQQ